MIAGGHCTYNPEPLADFLDAMEACEDLLAALAGDDWRPWAQRVLAELLPAHPDLPQRLRHIALNALWPEDQLNFHILMFGFRELTASLERRREGSHVAHGRRQQATHVTPQVQDQRVDRVLIKRQQSPCLQTPGLIRQPPRCGHGTFRIRRKGLAHTLRPPGFLIGQPMH